MSQLPPVAATVPGSQRRLLRRQQSQQQPSASEAVATPGDAATDAAAAVLATLPASSGGSGSRPVQSPFAAPSQPLAKNLHAELCAAADSADALAPLGNAGGGGIGGSLRSVLHPTKALSRALSSRIGDLSPAGFAR